MTMKAVNYSKNLKRNLSKVLVFNSWSFARCSWCSIYREGSRPSYGGYLPSAAILDSPQPHAPV